MVALVRMGSARLILVILLLVSGSVSARDYLEVWPAGWSEVEPLFTTSIFADRFFAVQDEAGTSFLSIDGTYFKELNLTYRTVRAGAIGEEVVLRSEAELNSAFLGLDDSGRRHVLWLEHSDQGNSIHYASFVLPYGDTQELTVLVTERLIQDLNACLAGGTIHLAWSQRDPFYQIHYAQIRDGQISPVEVVTDTQDLSVRPSLIVDEKGVVHLAWMETGPMGVEIRYSRRGEDGWAAPMKLGEGSVQDIQQGGLISLATFGSTVYAAWSALPRNSSRLHVFLSTFPFDGQPTVPSVLAEGSKPRFVQGTNQPELVWQGVGSFGSEIHFQPLNGTPINLTVGRKGAFRPEAHAVGEHRYVYWIQANADGSYQVFGINNQFPKVISLWRKMGIDEEAPLYHLGFLFLSTLMLAAVYTIANLGVLLLNAGLYSLLQRVGCYRRQPLFYQISLLGALTLVLRRLPIPATQPAFFGLFHYALSFCLATLGTWSLLRRVKQRHFLFTMGALLIWMLLFQFVALIPQNILV